MLNLLIVEDDLDLAETLVDYLELESIICDHATNGVAGLNLIRQTSYKVIVLDINLPRMNGLSVCEAMRQEGIDTPVIMLTARDSLTEKLEGFEAGADDYLIKPFAMEELVARIKALSKRRSGQVERFAIDNLTIDLQKKQATRGSVTLNLSPTAFRILEVLARHSPNPVSREALMQAVWGEDPPDSNSLKVHLHNLRKKVEAKGCPRLIHTLNGQGFALYSSGQLTP